MSDSTTNPVNGTEPDPARDSTGADVLDAPLPVAAGQPSPPRGALMPLPAEQVVEGMRAYQRLLRELLEPSDWQIEDKNGRPLERPFLKKSGWRKIARAFNLSFERVHSRVDRDEHGIPERAEVWIRAVAPNGQYGDGDGYCSAEEGRFQSQRGRQKLENDLRATAATRAKNRATADLVGMGEVSAEEINPDGVRDPAERLALTNGAEASRELASMAFQALIGILGGEQAADQVAQRITSEDGHLSAAAGRALVYVAGEHSRREQVQSDPGDPASASGPEHRAS